MYIAVYYFLISAVSNTRVFWFTYIYFFVIVIWHVPFLFTSFGLFIFLWGCVFTVCLYFCNALRTFEEYSHSLLKVQNCKVLPVFCWDNISKINCFHFCSFFHVFSIDFLPPVTTFLRFSNLILFTEQRFEFVFEIIFIRFSWWFMFLKNLEKRKHLKLSIFRSAWMFSTTFCWYYGSL